MPSAKRSLDQRVLLAPSRLVSGYPLQSGYDMGIAATAASVRFDGPDFDLEEDELELVERAVTAVQKAHDAYLWRPPLTQDEFMDEEIGYVLVRSPAERLRAQQMRRKLIRQAVAEGDRCLPPLMQRGLVLTVTTWEEEFAPVPASVAPEFPFAALVSVQTMD